MNKLSAILWDLDGVLVDTSSFHYEAWREVTVSLGIPYSFETFKNTFGMTNPTILNMLLGRTLETEEMEAISMRKEQLFRRAIHGQVEALPGARAWLAWFQAQGIPQAVASSAPPENIDVLVDALALRPYFQALVSAYFMPGKPDPAVFLEAARQLSQPPANCLVIEDSTAGITAAQRAGMRCLAVATTHPPEKLQEASWVTRRLNELAPSQAAAWFNSNQ